MENIDLTPLPPPPPAYEAETEKATLLKKHARRKAGRPRVIIDDNVTRKDFSDDRSFLLHKKKIATQKCRQKQEEKCTQAILYASTMRDLLDVFWLGGDLTKQVDTLIDKVSFLECFILHEFGVDILKKCTSEYEKKQNN